MPISRALASRYLSYNFLQQINLAGLYGVACAAIAWIFILQGCRNGKYAPVMIGYVFVLLTAFYKSHIFIAIAFLALVYPCLFLRSAPVRWRAAAGVVFVLVFCAAVWVSQKIPGVPLLRLDFSAAGAYSKTLFETYDRGFLKSILEPLILPRHPKIILALYASAMIPALQLRRMAGCGWSGDFAGSKDTRSRHRLFSAACGPELSGDGAGAGGGFAWRGHLRRAFEPLPVVWAYFGLVVWTAGFGCVRPFYGDNPPQGRRAQAAAALVVLCAFAVPWAYGSNLQTFPARKGYGEFRGIQRRSRLHLIDAASYIRRHMRKPGRRPGFLMAIRNCWWGR